VGVIVLRWERRATGSVFYFICRLGGPLRLWICQAAVREVLQIWLDCGVCGGRAIAVLWAGRDPCVVLLILWLTRYGVCR